MAGMAKIGGCNDNGKARMGKETERAKTIVRNSKQKRAKNK